MTVRWVYISEQEELLIDTITYAYRFTFVAIILWWAFYLLRCCLCLLMGEVTMHDMSTFHHFSIYLTSSQMILFHLASHHPIPCNIILSYIISSHLVSSHLISSPHIILFNLLKFHLLPHIVTHNLILLSNAQPLTQTQTLSHTYIHPRTQTNWISLSLSHTHSHIHTLTQTHFLSLTYSHTHTHSPSFSHEHTFPAQCDSLRVRSNA